MTWVARRREPLDSVHGLPDIQGRIAQIREKMADDEAAHSQEDDLYVATLGHIASGTCVDPLGCAQAALEATQLEFARWMA